MLGYSPTLEKHKRHLPSTVGQSHAYRRRSQKAQRELNPPTQDQCQATYEQQILGKVQHLEARPLLIHDQTGILALLEVANQTDS